MTDLSQSLNSRTAIAGRHHIMIEETNLRTGATYRYVQTTDDTVGDFGDAYTAAERAILENNDPLVRTAHGIRSTIRSMNAATIGL